jgi:uncharacterized protein
MELSLESRFKALGSRSAPLRLLAFFGLLLAIWVPIALPLAALIPDPNWDSIVTLLVLYGEFILLVRWWGRSVHGQPQMLRQLGLVWTRRNGRDWLLGWAIGVGAVAALVGIETLLHWVTWQEPPPQFPQFVFEGTLIGAAIGFVEELLFRGFLLDELERDYSGRRSLWICSLLFAGLHFLKPLTWRLIAPFPGLVLFSMILIWAKRRRRGRLGLSMGFHGGLVGSFYWVNVSNLIQSQVPDWLTGIDKHPFAGLLGFSLLAAIGWVMRGRSMGSKT